MALEHIYMGDGGIVLSFDNAGTYPDLPLVNHRGIRVQSMYCENAPIEDEDVLRKADIPTLAAPADAPYIVTTLTGDLSQERSLTAGDGITVTDNGANSTIVVDAEEAMLFGWAF